MTRIGRTTLRAKAALAMTLAAMAATVGAADAQESGLVGTWDITLASAGMPFPPGLSMTWTFAAGDDGALTGSFTMAAMGESLTQDMSELTVDGDAFDFIVRIEEQGEAGEFIFDGTLSEDEVSGTFEIVPEGMPAMVSGTFSGTRAEADGS
ncbi:hypothetical protein [Candidatus Palauibacter sp.]|uniref:hypothetical protein n=1 Tax=Candidatus Palauibacter sp. TaxID=3101350 RepID=UPI003B028820